MGEALHTLCPKEPSPRWLLESVPVSLLQLPSKLADSSQP